MIKTVPLEVPEQAPIEEDDPPTNDAREKDKNFVEDLKATKNAWGKLDQKKLRYSYFGKAPAGSPSSQEALRVRRIERRTAAARKR